jgi:hypothetical protein
VVTVLNSLADAAPLYSAREDTDHRIYNLIRFAFLGGAQQVKAVRVMNTDNAVKATLTLDDPSAAGIIRIDAKYEGNYGNNLSVVVGDDPDDATKTRVQIYLSGVLVHSVTSTVNHGSAGFTDNVVLLLNELDSNYITATDLGDGDNDLDDLSDTALASGANGDAVTVTEYNAALALFQAVEVHLVSTDVVSASILTAIATWADARRAEGQRLQVVLGSDTADSAATITSDAQGFNTESVVYVGPGAWLPNVAGVSTLYKGAQIASIVSGMIASTGQRAVTGLQLPLTTAIEAISLTTSQIKSALAGGVCLITPTPFGTTPGTKIERGLTTLYNPSGSQLPSFKLIRTVRIADAISRGLVAASVFFIGAELNDVPGQRNIIDAITRFLNTQVEARRIDPNFTVVLDSAQDNSGPNLFFLVGIVPIHAVEMVFVTVEI